MVSRVPGRCPSLRELLGLRPECGLAFRCGSRHKLPFLAKLGGSGRIGSLPAKVPPEVPPEKMRMSRLYPAFVFVLFLAFDQFACHTICGAAPNSPPAKAAKSATSVLPWIGEKEISISASTAGTFSLSYPALVAGSDKHLRPCGPAKMPTACRWSTPRAARAACNSTRPR